MIQIFDVGKQRNIRMKLFQKVVRLEKTNYWEENFGFSLLKVEVIFTLEINENLCDKTMNCANGLDDKIKVLPMRFVSFLKHIDALQCSWLVSFL